VIPAAFDYRRAGSTDEAVAWLAELGADGRVLAGGQSLIPAMRYRFARPAVLVDINRVAELDYLRENGALVLGALVRDSALEHAP
jgi:carbon-monoxide dehydrogenase medium subunit